MHDDLRSARPPLSPVRFLRWLWRLTLDIIWEYRRDGVGDLAASITFWTLLTIPAAALAMVSAVSAVEPIVGRSLATDFETEVKNYVANTFADSHTINGAVQSLFENTNAGVLTVATAVAIFSLSRGFAGMIRALDQAYGVHDGRAWWHVRIVAVGLGLGSVVVVTSAATALALLPRLPGGSLTIALAAPLAVIVLIVWAATMFHVAPYHHTPWRYDLPGAVLTAVGWVLSTQGFAAYVRSTDDANRVQSIVGAVLLALTLMYLLSNVMLVGAELNHVLANRAGVIQEPVRWRDRGRQLRSRFDHHGDNDDRDDQSAGHHQTSATEPTTPSSGTAP